MMGWHFSCSQINKCSNIGLFYINWKSKFPQFCFQASNVLTIETSRPINENVDERLASWLTDWLTDWPTDWLTDRLNDGMIAHASVCGADIGKGKRFITSYHSFIGQYQLDLILNAEEYEYCELTNQRVGVLIIIHEANTSPFLWPTYVMTSPGMHNRIEIHSSRVSTSASHSTLSISSQIAYHIISY